MGLAAMPRPTAAKATTKRSQVARPVNGIRKCEVLSKLDIGGKIVTRQKMREGGNFRPLSIGQAHGTDPHGIPRTRLIQKNRELSGCLGFFPVPGAESALLRSPDDSGPDFADVLGPGSVVFVVALAVRADSVGSVGVRPF